METRLVRLRLKGHPVEQYSVAGLRFRRDGKWQRVSEKIAAILKTRRASNTNPDSPKIFEVVTEAEAEAKEEKAREKAVPKPPSEQPVALSREDVVSESELAIQPYKGRTARELAKKIERGSYTVQELEEIRLFEVAHNNRKTVLRAIDAKLEG